MLWEEHNRLQAVMRLASTKQRNWWKLQLLK